MKKKEYKVFVKTLHTRQLLNELNSVRAQLSAPYGWDLFGFMDDDEDKIEELCMQREVIHKELETREHIPNKRETKAKRQARAKQKRNSGSKRKQK